MLNKAASIFSLFCGIAMLVVWTFLLATGQVVELHSTPLEAISLLCAEFLTAMLLIIGGSGMLAAKSWGVRTALVALGSLLYCAVYSIGVFSQGGNLPAAGFFVTITIFTAIFSTMLITRSIKGGVQ